MKILCAGTYVIDTITGIINGSINPGSGHGTHISSHPGGNALNVAFDLVNLGTKPADVICAGCIGDDFEGAYLKSELKKSNITDKTIVAENANTDKSLIITHPDDERTFIVDHGASLKFSSKDIISLIKEFKPEIFYIGESSVSPDVDGNLGTIIETARNSGCFTVLDYIILQNSHSGSIFECAKNTDVLHLNEYEAEVITGSKNIEKAAEFMREKGFKTVFISEGGRGFALACGNSVKRFPVYKVECVDGTGAGDAFCAGIISYVNTNGELKSIEAAAEYASACGAAAVTEKGCTKGVRKDKVNKILDEFAY